MEASRMRSFICLAALLVIVGAKLQNVTIKGTVICNKKRLEDVTVKLMEKDTFTPDDTLSEVKTNRDGEFHLFGQEDEVLGIEPYLIFTHTCNVKKENCYRETKFDIPKNVLGGEYDMTYVTLDIVQYDDKQHC